MMIIIIIIIIITIVIVTVWVFSKVIRTRRIMVEINVLQQK